MDLEELGWNWSESSLPEDQLSVVKGAMQAAKGEEQSVVLPTACEPQGLDQQDIPDSAIMAPFVGQPTAI